MPTDPYLLAALASILGFITIANNASIITGPLINSGYRIYISKIIASTSVAVGSIIYGVLMKPPYDCGDPSGIRDVAVTVYLSTLIPFIIATAMKIPFSLSMATISAVVGSSIVYGRDIYSWAASITSLWLLSAILAVVAGLYIYRFLSSISSRLGIAKVLSISRIGVLASSACLGVLLGANNVGFISSISCHSFLPAVAVAGGLAIFFSNITLLEGLFRMVSVRYVSVLSIQLSLILFTLVATLLGLPASLVYIQVFTLVGYRLATLLSLGFRELMLRVLAVWVLSIASSIMASMVLSIYINLTYVR